MLSRNSCAQDSGRERWERKTKLVSLATSCHPQKVHEAIRMLADETSEEGRSSGVLHLDETIRLQDGSSAAVRDLLAEQHPHSEPAMAEALI